MIPHTGAELTPDLQVNTKAMAVIMQELVQGSPKDEAWLRERAKTAHLTTHEYAALDSLRTRLFEQGAMLLPLVDNETWN